MTEDILEWQMSTEKGRQFVAEILDLCGAGALGGVGNYAKDFYSMGRRAVGEDILNMVRDISMSDGLALEYQMMREHKKRMEEDEDE